MSKQQQSLIIKDMDCYRVSPLVNNVRNDLPESLTATQTGTVKISA
jgi:hypothetical protein